MLSNLHLQRLKLFNRLDISYESNDGHKSTCCEAEFNQEELELLDDALCQVDLPMDESAALYYVCGYISFKENTLKSDFPNESVDSEFTELLSRGKLCHPKLELVSFARSCLHIFKSYSKKYNICGNKLYRMFCYLSECYPCDLRESISIVYVEGFLMFFSKVS